MRHNAFGRNRLAEIAFDLDPPLHVGIHLWFEKPHGRPACSLGAIERAIGALAPLGSLARRP
jgi:hypothetical protein